MTKITTKNFGEIEVPENRIIRFERGLIGFEEARRYFLMDADGGDMFKWLQCVDRPELCFLVAEPVSFLFDYSLELTDITVESLKITSPDEVLIYAIVVVPEDPARISANLCGPLVINAGSKLGEQVVSTDPAHGVRHYILDEMKKNAAKIAPPPDAAAPPAPDPAAIPTPPAASAKGL